jgi:hypothetical protein
MHWDIDDWDQLLHRALFVSIATMLYAGPASAIALDRFLGDEFQDKVSSSAFDEWLPLIVVVWLAAIPLVQGFRHWDENPEASVAWLGVFLGIALLPTLVGFVFVYRAASVLVILPALSFPFQWLDVPSPEMDLAVAFAQVVTYTLFFAVPLGALIVQLLQLRGSTNH